MKTVRKIQTQTVDRISGLRGRTRRGIAMMWLIILAPAIALLLCLIIEAGNLWMAKVELRTALEAAALAGVKTWADQSESDGHIAPGDFAKTSAARTAAIAAAAANTFNAVAISLNRNETGDGNSINGYDNALCTGDILMGGFAIAGSAQFNASASVGCGRGIAILDQDFAMLTQKTLVVDPVCGSIFGPHTITGIAVATARCTGGNSQVVQNPQAVHVTGVSCP